MTIRYNLQGGPGTTNTARHMVQIQNHQAMIVCAGALQSHTLSARLAGGVVGVNTNINGVTRINEAATASSGSVDVAHIAIGRVLVLQHNAVSI